MKRTCFKCPSIKILVEREKYISQECFWELSLLQKS